MGKFLTVPSSIPLCFLYCVFKSQFKIVAAYITALMGHFPGQLHFRGISQGGVLGLALIMTLLVVNLQGHTQQELKFTDVVNSSTSVADLSAQAASHRSYLHWLLTFLHQQKRLKATVLKEGGEQMTILIACNVSGNCYIRDIWLSTNKWTLRRKHNIKAEKMCLPVWGILNGNMPANSVRNGE